MTTTKIFLTGHSQAIRLPKEFRFKGAEVEVFRRGYEVLMHEKLVTADRLSKVLAQMPDDFYLEERVDEPPQER